MLSPRGRLPFLALLVLMLASAVTGARAGASTLTGVEIRPAPDGVHEEIVLTFEPGVPDLDVRNDASGIRASLPNTTAGDVAVEPARLSRSGAGLELALERPGATLKGFHIEGKTIVIRVTRAPADAGGAGYRLGIGDVVAVSVYRSQDLSGDFPILQDGTILMPLIGAVPAAGESVTELVTRIRTMLSDYLVDPQVRAGVKDYQSQFVVITGAVATARRIAIRPGMTLKALLSEAGVTLAGGQGVVLTRSDGDLAELSIADLDRSDAPLPRDGDVLTVQDPDSIFISGEVRRPGRYVYTPGLTLQQALVLAEGLTEWASKKEIRIQRQVGDQTVDEVINLKKVEERKIPDPQLKPGDLVLVRRRIL